MGEGSQRGTRSQGPQFGATVSILLPRGYQGDPWQQTTTPANERLEPGPVHFDC